MRFNVNHNVRVRLTDAGRAAMRKNHDTIYATWREKPEYAPPVQEDADGWSTWQLWRLMQEFGPHIYNGCDIPFETDLEIVEA